MLQGYWGDPRSIALDKSIGLSENRIDQNVLFSFNQFQKGLTPDY